MTKVIVRERAVLTRSAALEVVAELAARQEGAVGRRQVYEAGVPRWVVRLELRTRRWQAVGRQAVVVHNGALAWRTRCWTALLNVSSRAALDGVTALRWAGLDALRDTTVHVIVPKSSTPQHPAGVRVHESRRFREPDVVGAGARRTRPAVAAVHAALWARTDRQATYFLVLAVQQRVTTVAELAEVVSRVRRHPRRLLLRRVVAELAGGVRALGELDVARDLRRRGLPEPARQTVRRRPSGTCYLDCELPAYRLVLELDGSGHDEPWQRVTDLVRDIGTAAEGSTTVRIPLAVYVLDRERVLDALEELLRARGWQAAAA